VAEPTGQLAKLRQAAALLAEVIEAAEADFRCPSCGNADEPTTEETPDLGAGAPDRVTCLRCGKSAPRSEWGSTEVLDG